ncbi:Mitochondrial inner membrane i-AAA protease supercomplex subunit [Venturia nashicola]|uniref:Mitochondrial inner membrane i-AAA protease supercomplex subunit n=1 Tax=Venturia nashicola TaxID=86259 RepID=A0A4Z1NHY5_9PEZI|nr:Mitochondrial inner membrane i-AAA protease supercomplex subunit [Venturia nashicola]TLD21765.1 Mitochondrial inner membrane i-AAA protease supercomplex subunit [Venturia nashicola]
MSALVFADRKKFETLPSEVQKLVEGLTPLQFNKLRVSISGFDHFDFMQLPLEVREMIYKYLVLTSGVFSDPWTRYDTRVVPHPILSVSKEICSEVQSVMYRNTTFRHSFEMKDYLADTIENHRFAFRQFRNVELGLTPLGWHIHDDKEEQDLPRLLQCLVNILASRDSLLETSLKLTFVNRTATSRRSTNAYFAIHYHKPCSHGLFEPCQRGLPGTDEEQLEELKAAWMRAQFLHLVNKFRTILANKGLNFVTVTTNVEQTGHNVRVQRINEFTVKFRNLHTGKEGVMKCGDAGRKIKVKYGTGVGALDNLV